MVVVGWQVPVVPFLVATVSALCPQNCHPLVLRGVIGVPKGAEGSPNWGGEDLSVPMGGLRRTVEVPKELQVPKGGLEVPKKVYKVLCVPRESDGPHHPQEWVGGPQGSTQQGWWRCLRCLRV